MNRWIPVMLATGLVPAGAASAVEVLLLDNFQAGVAAAMETALEADGHNVTIGASSGSFDANTDLSSFDVILIADDGVTGSTIVPPLPVQTAFREFVEAGGGLIVAVPFAERINHAVGTIASVLPTTDNADAFSDETAAGNIAAETVGSDPVVLAGVSGAWNMTTSGDIADSYQTLDLDYAADAVTQASMNQVVIPGGAWELLVTREYGLGRTANFNVIIDDVALGIGDLFALVSNTLTWCGSGGTGTATAKTGSSIAEIEDVDSDGIDDFVVGAPNDDTNGTNAGRITVYSGATGQILYTSLGRDPGDKYGFAVASAGDVDGDDAGDILVSAPFAERGGLARRGLVKLLSGADGSEIDNVRGDNANHEFGYSIDGNSDLDGDGDLDCIIGAPAAGKGKVYVYDAETMTRIRTVRGFGSGDRFGHAVAMVNRISPDPLGDFIVGAPRNDRNGLSAGAAYIHGYDDDDEKWVLWRSHFGDQPGGEFGAAVASLGLVSGDSRFDYAIAAPKYDPTGSKAKAGKVWAYSGVNGSVFWERGGSQQNDRFGSSMRGGGDVDDDNVNDVAIGSPRQDVNGNNCGRVTLYSGFDGAQIKRINGTDAGNQLGVAAIVEDNGGDGADDVIVGAPNDSSPQNKNGRVRRIAFDGTESAFTSIECDEDRTGDGVVDTADLTLLLATWDGDVAALLELLDEWGACGLQD